MKRRSQLALAAISAATLVGSAGSSALAVQADALPERPSGSFGGQRIDDEADCLELVPETVAAPAVLGGDTISVEAAVLLDEVSLERGQAVMAKAAESYRPLGITLNASFHSVAFPPTDTDADGDPVADPDEFIELSKAYFGGARPEGSDVVYLLTNDELEGAAGMADCIGGVRYPEHAFAVGENREPDELPVGPVRFYVSGTAKIVAHEIGHLLGAHHHYANCAEGVSPHIAEGDPTPCTVMFNFLDFISTTFGTLEGAVIRGHAVEFASP